MQIIFNGIGHEVFVPSLEASTPDDSNTKEDELSQAFTWN